MGISILVNEEQLSKAEVPIEVTPLGISILVNKEQLLKAEAPIEVTLYSFPSIVTDDGIVIAISDTGVLQITSHLLGSTFVTVYLRI